MEKKYHGGTASKYGLHSDSISANALHAVKQLQKAGYESYIVGGSVRDLLLGYEPKDYDVVSSAKPNEITKCFPRSRIIGRRFKLVHVYYDREFIEVSTFRAPPDKNIGKSKYTKQGLILEDNQYGSLEEDIMRRDFTINAMFYDPFADKLLCHTSAIDDLQHKLLRFIGEPRERYQEDPVRILRAIRFTAKANLNMEHSVSSNIMTMSDLLRQISAARLFEEMIKWIRSGASLKIFELFKQYQLIDILYPSVGVYLKHDANNDYHVLLESLFYNTDKRIAENKPVTPVFTLTVMLWPAIVKQCETLINKGKRPLLALSRAWQSIMKTQQQHVSLPRRLVVASHEICLLQHYFTSRSAKRLYYVLNHSRFRAAYDLLWLRTKAGIGDEDLMQWWTTIQEVDNTESQKMIKARARYPIRRKTKRLS